MPHLHSQEARLRRGARAQERGYLRAQPREGFGWMEVPANLRSRAQAMTSSLAKHDEHNRAVGQPLHYARDAARAASSIVGDEETRRALALHRRANRAKHDWSCARALPVQDPSDGAEAMSEAAMLDAEAETPSRSGQPRMGEALDRFYIGEPTTEAEVQTDPPMEATVRAAATQTVATLANTAILDEGGMTAWAAWAARERPHARGQGGSRRELAALLLGALLALVGVGAASLLGHGELVCAPKGLTDIGSVKGVIPSISAQGFTSGEAEHFDCAKGYSPGEAEGIGFVSGDTIGLAKGILSGKAMDIHIGFVKGLHIGSTEGFIPGSVEHIDLHDIITGEEGCHDDSSPEGGYPAGGCPDAAAREDDPSVARQASCVGLSMGTDEAGGIEHTSSVQGFISGEEGCLDDSPPEGDYPACDYPGGQSEPQAPLPLSDEELDEWCDAVASRAQELAVLGDGPDRAWAAPDACHDYSLGEEDCDWLYEQCGGFDVDDLLDDSPPEDEGHFSGSPAR